MVLTFARFALSFLHTAEMCCPLQQYDFRQEDTSDSSIDDDKAITHARKAVYDSHSASTTENNTCSLDFPAFVYLYHIILSLDGE
jgi:hypothetical protein